VLQGSILEIALRGSTHGYRIGDGGATFTSDSSPARPDSPSSSAVADHDAAVVANGLVTSFGGQTR
jgi:hypothetical protein